MDSIINIKSASLEKKLVMKYTNLVAFPKRKLAGYQTRKKNVFSNVQVPCGIYCNCNILQLLV